MLDRASSPASAEDLGLERDHEVKIDGVVLLGRRLDTTTVRPGERVRTTLYWQARETAPASRDLSLQLGEMTLFEGAPVHDTYPFAAWRRSEIVADRYDPRLPLDAEPGTYRLMVRVEGATSIDLGSVVVQETHRTYEVPHLSHYVGASLGREVELVGYDLSSETVAQGETLHVTLTWRALREMERDYTVFTHLVAPDGSMTGQKDGQPGDGTYPTTLWAEGEVVTDIYRIPVSTSAPTGIHRLEVGMYVAESGTRLAVEGSADNALTLHTISVTE